MAAPPFIAAELKSFLPGSEPPGFNTGATVRVLDATSGASLPTATVTINGVPLPYRAASQSYEGDVVVAPGAGVTLSVAAGGSTYTRLATQFTSYPAISGPAPGATWASDTVHAVTWSGGAPSVGATYVLGVLGADDPNGLLVWPCDHHLQEVPLGTTQYEFPAYGVTGGARRLVVGIATLLSIPGAAPGSGFAIAGFDQVPITVTGMPVTPRDPGVEASLQGVTWTGTQYVVVGSGGTVLTSPDGKAWATHGTGDPTQVLAGVAWSGTQLVAVELASGGIVTSPDGSHWTRQVSGTTNPLYAVTWSGTEFVAVGFWGTILASPNGTTWSPRTSGTSDILQGITWSGTQLVAVGRGGAILTSPDGVAWTPRASNASESFNGVTWTGTQFVAVGTGGSVASSPDGITWAPQSLGTSDSLLGVAWTGGQLVAVGGSGASSSIFTSPDGTTWARQAAGSCDALAGVAWSGTRLVMVGAGGAILTSP